MKPVLFLFPLLALVFVLWGHTLSRAARWRDKWLRREGYRLLSSRICWFWRGPFTLRSVEGQVVFRLVVRDREGQVRKGWMRCGGFLAGMLGRERIAVQWADA